MNGGSIRYIVLNGYLRVCGKADEVLHYADTYDILTYVFELIEDNNIDIEELENDVMRDDWRYYVPLFFNKTNELVRKYNELNREIKELKEKTNAK